MQISHETHLQMLFEQHLKIINDCVTPTANNLEHPRTGRQKERAHLVPSGSSFHTMPDTAVDSNFLHLAASLLRSGTQMQSRDKTWDLTKSK